MHLKRSPWENKVFAEESLAHVDRQFLAGTAQEVDFLEGELGLKPGDRILDLGCGAGRHAIEMAKRGFAVAGVDISEVMLDAARTRAENENVEVSFVQLDLRDLAEYFQDDEPAFDAAICLCESGFGVLGWKSDLKLLSDIRKLLTENGHLVITTYNGIKKYRSDRVSSSSFDFLKGISHWAVPDDWHGGGKLAEDQRVYIPSEIAMLLQLAGFGEVQVYGCGPGDFRKQDLVPDDTEMMIVCRK
jgi:cyclopropane fatty-acyl-phospholipid synthase-like methyltransferase